METEKIMLPENIDKKVKRISYNMGLSSQDFFINAVVYYLKALENQLKLKQELEIWEKVSDEDLIKFEKKI
jgi:hypothetical protein